MNPLNRRHFLHDTAALAAAIASLPASSARAADAEKEKEVTDSKKVSPNERLNVACVGVHGQGKGHLAGYTKLKDAQVVAICDVDSNVGGAARERMAKATGIDVKYVQDIRKLLTALATTGATRPVMCCDPTTAVLMATLRQAGVVPFPAMTAAGGTTLPGPQMFNTPGGILTIDNPVERVWGWDYLEPLCDALGITNFFECGIFSVGTGGGVSSFFLSRS